MPHNDSEWFITHNMDDFHQSNVEWKKLDTRVYYILHDSFYTLYKKKKKNSSMLLLEVRTVAIPSGREGANKWKGTQVTFWKGWYFVSCASIVGENSLSCRCTCILFYIYKYEPTKI